MAILLVLMISGAAIRGAVTPAIAMQPLEAESHPVSCWASLGGSEAVYSGGTQAPWYVANTSCSNPVGYRWYRNDDLGGSGYYYEIYECEDQTSCSQVFYASSTGFAAMRVIIQDAFLGSGEGTMILNVYP